MPTVVEVQALIKARDEISSVLDKAADRTQNFKEKTNEAGSALEEMGHRFERVGERIAEYFAIREVARFTEQVFETAHSLELLSLQTGIGVEELQVLSAATQAYGIESERLGMVIFQLSRRIAKGDDSVATALAMMGMALKDVQGLNGEEQFLKIARGLNTLTGNSKDLAATDLFGGRMGKSILAFSTDVDGAMEHARNSVHIASEQAVKDAAAWDVAWKQLIISIKASAIDTFGGLQKVVTDTHAAVEQGVTKWDLFKSALKDLWAAGLNPTHLTMTNLAGTIEDAARKAEIEKKATEAETAAHKEAIPVLTAQEQAQRVLSTLILNTARPILDWQEDYLKQLKLIGQLNAQNAEAIGVSAQQLKRWEEEIKRAANSTKELTDAWAKAAEAQGALAKTELDVQLKKLQTQEKEEIASLERRQKAGLISEDKYQKDLYGIKDFYERKTEELLKRQEDIALDKVNEEYGKRKASLDKQYSEQVIDYQTYLEELSALDEEFAARRDEVNVKADAHNAQERRKIWDEYYGYLEKRQDETLKHGIDDALKLASAEKMITSSITYDLTTEEGRKKFRELNPSSSTLPPADYFKTHSLEDAVRSGMVDLYAGFHGSMIGPATPGGGPEEARSGIGGSSGSGSSSASGPSIGGGSSSAIGTGPIAGGGGAAAGGAAGGGTQIHITVNANQADLGRRIADEITRRLRQQRLFPSA